MILQNYVKSSEQTNKTVEKVSTGLIEKCLLTVDKDMLEYSVSCPKSTPGSVPLVTTVIKL